MFQGRVSDLTGIRPLRVRNDAGEEIPAYAAMLISGVASDGVFLVDQPTAANMTDRIIFNGPTVIPATVDNGDESAAKGEGTAFIGFPAIALCYPSDAAPVVEDNWGTEANRWKLRKGNTGFMAMGNLLTTSAGHYGQMMASRGGGGGISLYTRNYAWKSSYQFIGDGTDWELLYETVTLPTSGTYIINAKGYGHVFNVGSEPQLINVQWAYLGGGGLGNDFLNFGGELCLTSTPISSAFGASSIFTLKFTDTVIVSDETDFKLTGSMAPRFGQPQGYFVFAGFGEVSVHRISEEYI